MTQLLAYHGDAAIKKKYVTRVKAHAAADEIVKGQYWENGKGCAIGCSIHSPDHSRYETELGIPESLARLEDFLFENLPNDQAKQWPVKFLEAINPGVDLYPVTWKFLHWLLVDPKDGVVRFANDAIRKSINDIAAMCLVEQTKRVPIEEWAAARAAWAAWDAARAAWAAWDAEWAAWDAARDAGAAAGDAAWAASWAAAGDATRAFGAAGDARAAAVVLQSEKLLGLLRAAQIPGGA